MTLTLLFDLDDTLLGNNINTFLPAYLKALGKHLINHVTPDRMVKNLLSATDLMVRNEYAGLSLEHAFDQGFYPAIGKSKQELRETLEYFYDQVFPSLQSLTHQRPEAIRVVKQAQAQGHIMVVATNPLFPRQAIIHRLDWAGLPPEITPFALITSYEYFHFSKPNPAYFAEILAQLGWPEQPAVVIGNSVEDDLLPAARLGLPGYLVTDSSVVLPADLHPMSAQGPLSGVSAWIEQIDAAGLQIDFNTPAGLLAVLKSTPAAMETISRSLASEHWQTRPAPDQWSLTEIFCHLRDVDLEVNLPRVDKIMTEKNPFVQGINSDTWPDERGYNREDGLTGLQGFIDARTRLVERLSSLPAEAWQFTARHAIFGPTRLIELISFIATHDQSHIRQVQSVVASIRQ
jgi:FMN phosphatase YigB (HAD superfamily)